MGADCGRDGYCVDGYCVGAAFWLTATLGWRFWSGVGYCVTVTVGVGAAVGVGEVGETVGWPGRGWPAMTQGSVRTPDRDGAGMTTPPTEVGLESSTVAGAVVGTDIVRGGTVGAASGVVGVTVTVCVMVTVGTAGRVGIGLLDRVGTVGAARCRGAADVVRGRAVGVAVGVGVARAVGAR